MTEKTLYKCTRLPSQELLNMEALSRYAIENADISVNNVFIKRWNMGGAPTRPNGTVKKDISQRE